MRPFEHYLMCPLQQPSRLLEKFPARFLISAQTQEHRSTQVRARMQPVLKDEFVMLLDQPETEQSLPPAALSVRYSYHPADSIVKNILRVVEEREWDPDEIALDVTGIPLEYSLMLLRGLRDRLGSRRVMVTYTEAAAYASDVFTGGLKEINAVPGFVGSPDVLKPDLLVLLLGFEGHRSSAVHNKLDPEALVVVNPFPALRPGWEHRSFSNNIEVIRKANEARNCPANNPFAVVNVLEEIYQEYGAKYNINVAPLGVRPQAVGAALFAIRRADVRLIYHYPMEILPAIAVGSGTSWAYIVTFTDLCDLGESDEQAPA